MQPSPLRIDAYFLKELTFTLSDDLKNDSFENEGFSGLELEINDKTTSLEEANRWRSEVTVKATSKKNETVPYTFTIVMVGFFTLVENYPKDRAGMLVETNAPAVLYSSIREIAFNMTSRNPFPTLLLPSVTFLRPGPEKRPSIKKKLAKPRKK